MAQISLLLFLSAIIVCSAAPRTTVESNDIPQVRLAGDGVSASVGGYQASAGLGGNLNGGPSGGLYAQAGTPGGTGAGAGLQGSASAGGSAYSGAGVGNAGQSPGAPVFITVKGRRGHVRQRPAQREQRPADFYDNVFNIPISVLQGVNQLLGGGGGGGGSVTGGSPSGTRAVASSKSANTGSGATSASAGSGASSGPATKALNAYPSGGKNFFDEIFNIPISALKSVNQLLNVKNQQRGEAQRQVPV